MNFTDTIFPLGSSKVIFKGETSMNHERSTCLFEKAKELVAGGVSSQIRINEPADVPLFFTHA